MTWNISKLEFARKTDLVEPNMQGQFPRQKPIHLLIDWETKEIDAYAYDYSIGGTPMREWHGIVWSIALPSDTDAKYMKQFVEEKIIPQLDEYVDVFEVVWDGHNHVGQFNIDYDIIEENPILALQWKLQEDLNGVSEPEIGLYEVDYWFNGEYPEEITKDTTDEEIEKIAEREIEDAKDEGVIFDDDVEDYLIEYRDELREEE